MLHMKQIAVLTLAGFCAIAFPASGDNVGSKSPNDLTEKIEPALYTQDEQIKDFETYLDNLQGQDEWKIKILYEAGRSVGILKNRLGLEHEVHVFGKQGHAEESVVGFIGVEDEAPNIVRLIYRAGWAGTACYGSVEYRFVRFNTILKSFEESRKYAVLEENYCDLANVKRELQLYVSSSFRE